MKSDFLLIDKRVLPEVYEKVVTAKRILKDGKVKEITEATKMAGISRSVYYKYKDFVFEFAESTQGKKVTFTMVVQDKKGVLLEIINHISDEGANILTINQGLPINNFANISITIDISTLHGDINSLLNYLNSMVEVEKVDLVAME
ncbi:MAG: ACT domain-containing protein [Clostridium sp.]